MLDGRYLKYDINWVYNQDCVNNKKLNDDFFHFYATDYSAFKHQSGMLNFEIHIYDYAITVLPS